MITQITLETFTSPLVAAFSDMYSRIVNHLPHVIAACVILVVGYLIATFIRKFLDVSFQKLKFDSLLDKIGVAGVLGKVGFKASPSTLITKLLFYILMLFIIKNAANQLNVEDIVNIVDSIVEFIPRVAIAIVILLFGFIVAETIQNFVRNGLEAMSLDYAKPFSSIIFCFVFVIVLTVALDQLKIQTELLNDSVKIVLACLGVAAAIALGLGLRGLAKEIVSGVYVRDLFQTGTQVMIDDELAKVTGIGPVTTKLMKSDGGFIIIPNSELIDKKVEGYSAE